METSTQIQGTLFSQALHSFNISRQAKNLSPGTITNYTRNLAVFSCFLRQENIQTVEQIKPESIRLFFLHMREMGHNDGGIHCGYRVVKTFLNWFEREYDPAGWKNPIRKIDPPIWPKKILPPVSIEVVKRLLATCNSNHFFDLRDQAILLVLLDTGVRASELEAMDLADLDLASGVILIYHGKGRKFRPAFFEDDSRKALRRYLKLRKGPCPALWYNKDGGRLSTDGVRGMIRRRAALARVGRPQLHAFRRAFTLGMLRKKVSMVSIQRMLGHTDLTLIERYADQNWDDLREDHHSGSLIDDL